MNVFDVAISKSYTNQSMQGAGAIQGLPGKDGKDAPTITNIDIDESNVLTVALSDGNTFSGTIQTVSGTDGADGQNGVTPHIDPTTKHWFISTVDTGIVAEGKDGIQGLRGEKGDPGEPGQQGLQGISGEKGDDGYPFLIYKEYASISDFDASDFPEVGLMFMIKEYDENNVFPVYRYTGDENDPYSYITGLSNGEAIKGNKGDPGQRGEQGIPGKNGQDGITYTPTIGTIETLPSYQNATAAVTVDEEEKIAIFDFGIPKGKDGTNSGGESNNSGTPVGEIISYMGTICPQDYLICDGTEYQISDYPILAQHFVDNFGECNYFGGDGETTFAVPDLRGMFLRGTGKLGGDKGLKGKYIDYGGSSVRIEGNGVDVGKYQPPTYISGVYKSSSTNYIKLPNNPKYQDGDSISLGSSTNAKITSFASSSSETSYGSPTRPVNMSVLYCIKY